MKNSLSKEGLENDALYETLKALSDSITSIGLKLYVVGATARDLMMKLLDEYPSKRKTRDLDVAIALSDWSQFDNLSKIIQNNHFRKDPANQNSIMKEKSMTMITRWILFPLAILPERMKP